MKGEERRLILRHLSESQYEDVMKVLGSMPYIEFKVRSEGKNYLIFFFTFEYIFYIYILCSFNYTEKAYITNFNDFRYTMLENKILTNFFLYNYCWS